VVRHEVTLCSGHGPVVYVCLDKWGSLFVLFSPQSQCQMHLTELVCQFITSSNSHKYAVVFMDYLSKWPEVFPARNQTSLTIAWLLVEHIIPRDYYQNEGQLSCQSWWRKYKLLGLKKVNTTAYHAQTYGLVERFNSILTDMLAKNISHNVP